MTAYDEIERLRELRDASTKDDHDECCEPGMLFACTAWDALGPDGCVTKELAYLQETIETEVAVGARLVDENEALKSEVERLTRNTKDAQKENRYLLDRLVKYGAMLRNLADPDGGNWSMGPEVRESILELTNEMPSPSEGPTREQALEHNSKLLCAQVNRLVARFIGDPSQGSTKVLPPDLFKLACMAEDAAKMWSE